MDRRSQHDIAEADKQAHELIGELSLLAAVDRRITPEHVARRFRELLDDLADNAPPATVTAVAGGGTTDRSDTAPGRPARATHSSGAARRTRGGRAPVAGNSRRSRGSQGEPFPADEPLGPPEVSREADPRPAEDGYRGPTACATAGITYRQLDYWARTGLVEPSVQAAHGSGTQRLYSFRDILVLKVIKRLLDTGISLQQIRAAVQHLRDRGTEDLAEVTLMSDGVSVYECVSPDEVVDLLAGGQGVFGIALGRVWQEVAGELAAVRAEDGFIAATPGSPRPGASQDDLASSRLSRSS